MRPSIPSMLLSTITVLSPDQQFRAMGTTRQSIFVYQQASERLQSIYYGHREGVYQTPGQICAITWEPQADGSFLLRSQSTSGSIHLWHPATGNQVSTILPSRRLALTSAPDETLAFCASASDQHCLV
jgi:WD40 repeat protein